MHNGIVHQDAFCLSEDKYFPCTCLADSLPEYSYKELYNTCTMQFTKKGQALNKGICPCMLFKFTSTLKKMYPQTL